MSVLPGSLSLFLPILVQLLRGPGKVYTVLNGIIVTLGLVAGIRAESSLATVCTVILGILALGIVIFAIRGQRLAHHVEELATLSQRTISSEIAPLGETDERAEFARRYEEASREASIKTARFMPRVEAAQRAAIAAVGGLGNAPYLEDDLRYTILAGLVTAMAGPIAIFLILLIAIAG
ncbi:MAG: hypothetical protein Q4P33_07035 [Flaviflexus sp.]|nr:hypothetical protein [Flaviflexus sp.]